MKPNLFAMLWLSIFFVACQTTQKQETPDTVAVATPTPQEEPYVELCFLEANGKDSTKVNIAIEGKVVTGEMQWMPYEKDGAVGTLKGQIEGNTITADYQYVIEGSEQLEEKIFVLEENRLIEKTGPLEDKDGKLSIKDKTTLTNGAILKKVDCSL